MAATEVSGIYWTVDADTTPAISSVKELSSQVDEAEDTLSQLDSRMRKFRDSCASLGQRITKTNTVVNAYGQVNKKATEELRKLTEQQAKLKKASEGVNKGLAKMSRGAGQAGIQFQQFIGQIQGGQSTMLAFSQQSADLGIVLGFPMLGAIMGISASLIGIFLPSLMKSNDSLDLLEKATINVRAAMTLGVDGIASYSDEMKKLNLISDAMSKIKLANLIIEQEKATKIATKGMKDAIDDLKPWVGGLDRAVSKVFKKTTKEATSALHGLSVAVVKLTHNNGAEDLDNMAKALKRAADAGMLKTKQGLKLSNRLTDLIMKYELGKKKILLFKEALEDTTKIIKDETKEIDNNKSKNDALVKSLENKAFVLQNGERALALKLAGERKATEADIKSINTSYDVIDAEKDKTKAKADAVKALSEQKRAQQEMDRVFEDSFRDELARERTRKQEASKLESGAGSIADSRGDPVALLREQKAAELAVLQEAEAAGLQLHTDYTTLRQNINASYAESERMEREAKFIAESEAHAFLLSSVESLGAATTNMLVGMANGTMTAKEAMLGLGTTILNSAVSAIVEMGIQYVKSALIGVTAEESAAIAKQGIAAANAVQHTMAVTATVAELASIGAAAAMASTAAIPYVGPAMAPAAGVAMGAAIGAAGAGAIGAAPVAGMREHGGPVSAGKSYSMGEKNKPEMLVIPGSDGKVFSNAEMKGLMNGGSGGGGSPTVNNYAAEAGYTVKHRQDPVTQEHVFDIVMEQLGNANSFGRRALSQTSSVKSKVTNQRRN